MCMTNSYYTILDLFLTELKAVGFRVVSLGDILEMDLSRQTIYPLAHIIPDTAELNETTTTLNFEIIGADLVDFSKDDIREQTESFYGINNLQDVYQDILGKLSTFVKRLDNSDYELNYYFSLEPFSERMENLLAGWTLSFSITIKNIDDGRC